MFGLGSRNNSVRYGALFDVGSESIGIAIVESHVEDTYPRIIFSHRVHMRITGGESTPAERLRHLKEALFSASLILSRDGLEALRLENAHARVKDILLTVSAPWSHTVSRNVTYSGESELKISRALIDELVKSAEEEIETEIRKTHAEHTHGFAVVEKATVDVRINEYPVLHPIGLKGKEISLVQVTGLIPEDILLALSEVRDKVLPNVNIRSHTFLLTLFCVTRELLKEQPSLTLVHVTGETTEFGIVEDETLIESISIPFGLNTIVRECIGTSERTAQEIHSLLTLYHEGKLAKDDEKRMENVLTNYTTRIQSALHEHAVLRRFPREAFILAPSSFTELFKSLLHPVLTHEIGLEHELHTLPRDNFGTTPTHDSDDDHLSVLSHFFHKLNSCGEIDPS